MTTADTPSSPPATPTDAPPKHKPVPCVVCRYDLAGLPDNALCPECGTPADDTRGGPHIKLAKPAAVASAAAGSALLAWSVALWPLAIAIALIGGAIGLIGGESLAQVLWWRWPWLLGGVIACELCLGWWFLTPAERLSDGSRARGRWESCRRVTRALSFGGAIAVLGGVALTMIERGALAERLIASGAPIAERRWVLDAALVICGLGGAVCMIGAHLVGMRYAARLAGRARAWTLHGRLDRLARMPVRVVGFYALAWVLLPFVMLADLITGLLSLVYVAAFNLLTPLVLVGVMVASGRGLWALAGELRRASARGRGVRTGGG